jgi:hypothetical protein
LVPGALLGVALGGTSGTARLLLIPDLGFSALLAVLIRHGFERAGASYASWTARVTATAGLVLAHLVLAPIASLAQIQGLARGARADEAIAANAELGVTPAQRVLVVASSEPEVFFYPKEILADKAAGLVRCWSVLSAAAAPHRLTRTGEHSFTLEVTGRTDDEDGYEDQYFASRRFVAGDQVRQCGASIRIDAVDEGRPSKLSVELDEPLDSADLTFLSWEDGRLRHVRVPGLGEIADFPWSPVSGPSHASRVRALARAVWRTVRRQL